MARAVPARRNRCGTPRCCRPESPRRRRRIRSGGPRRRIPQPQWRGELLDAPAAMVDLFHRDPANGGASPQPAGPRSYRRSSSDWPPAGSWCAPALRATLHRRIGRRDSLPGSFGLPAAREGLEEGDDLSSDTPAICGTPPSPAPPPPRRSVHLGRHMQQVAGVLNHDQPVAGAETGRARSSETCVSRSPPKMTGMPGVRACNGLEIHGRTLNARRGSGQGSIDPYLALPRRPEPSPHEVEVGRPGRQRRDEPCRRARRWPGRQGSH